MIDTQQPGIPTEPVCTERNGAQDFAPCRNPAVYYVADSRGKIDTPCGQHIGFAFGVANEVYTVVRVDQYALPMLLAQYATR
ncbi:hypothetical protein ACFYYS_26045 [Streptomyces sp. NPDC002120]|uniref:hypothetical protein n=1 Tax=Streptomyces sp. NPDC002120 TaxID=3364631 RepID=UPI0036B95078